MIDLDSRLSNCFVTVFPELSATDLPEASQDNVPRWDSIATVTLLNILEDEFNVRFDLEALEQYTSYSSIRTFIENNG